MYSNCVQAVKQKNITNSNVSEDKKKVTCSHEATSCVIVGNSQPLYACCENAPKSPQRVYSEGMRWKNLNQVKES
tara:strand:+ start:348 stop:572 length:225 start_codon:yes stop_codon:yes gene_type:complete